jgi:hypothetical protein
MGGEDHNQLETHHVHTYGESNLCRHACEVPSVMICRHRHLPISTSTLVCCGLLTSLQKLLRALAPRGCKRLLRRLLQCLRVSVKSISGTRSGPDVATKWSCSVPALPKSQSEVLVGASAGRTIDLNRSGHRHRRRRHHLAWWISHVVSKVFAAVVLSCVTKTADGSVVEGLYSVTLWLRGGIPIVRQSQEKRLLLLV